MSASASAPIIDQYADFASLAAAEQEHIDYRVSLTQQKDSSLAIIAPHGGSIERRTSSIAAQLAGDTHNLYLFEGLDSEGSFETLHITSHRFDEPRCLALVAGCEQVVAVHGCAGAELALMIGGRDTALCHTIAEATSGIAVEVMLDNHAYPGKHKNNICNRGKSRRGVQLEFTDGLRGSPQEVELIAAIRSALG